MPAHLRQTLIPPLRIPHDGAVMFMALAFHTEDPDKVEDALNIFLFPDLSLSSGSESALLTRNWDVILGGRTLNSFVNTSLLMGKQKVAPIVCWDNASQMNSRAMFCIVFLGDEAKHPATYYMFLLIE